MLSLFENDITNYDIVVQNTPATKMASQKQKYWRKRVNCTWHVVHLQFYTYLRPKFKRITTIMSKRKLSKWYTDVDVYNFFQHES